MPPQMPKDGMRRGGKEIVPAPGTPPNPLLREGKGIPLVLIERSGRGMATKFCNSSSGKRPGSFPPRKGGKRGEMSGFANAEGWSQRERVRRPWPRSPAGKGKLEGGAPAAGREESHQTNPIHISSSMEQRKGKKRVYPIREFEASTTEGGMLGKEDGRPLPTII